MNASFDFVVAGSGAGGGAAASRLAAGGAKVLVLEKGGHAEPQADASEAIRRYYTDAGMSAGAGNVLMPIPTGTAVGGTTTINSGTCLRTPPESLKRWQKSCRGRFSASAFERRLDEAWAALRVKTAPAATMSRSSKLVIEGFKAIGIKDAGPLDRAEQGCVGSGRCCFVCPKGAKMTSYNAFLRAMEGDGNLRLAAGWELVTVKPPRGGPGPVRLVIRSAEGRWQSVECGALILAAGALKTPYFVRAFRLGENWRRAGDALSVHPAAKLFAAFKERVSGWKGVPQGAGAEDPTDDAIRYEGVYTPPELAALTMPLEGSRLRWWMERYDRAATFGFMIRDEARGSVRYPLDSPDRPLIRYSLLPADLERMKKGMRTVARAFFSAGAEKVVLPLNRSGNEVTSPQRLEMFDWDGVKPRMLSTMAFHPLGTCGMGRVVDHNLKLGRGLFVCDGSVVPESLGVNPQITIYAFALRLAAHLLKDGGRGA